MQKPHTKYLEVMFDEIAGLRKTIQEAKDRMIYYFGTGNSNWGFNDPQLQNIYDVLCRDEVRGEGTPGTEPRNCDKYLARDLVGAAALYCTENPGLPPMVEWNTVQYLGFCRWLFRNDDDR